MRAPRRAAVLAAVVMALLGGCSSTASPSSSEPPAPTSSTVAQPTGDATTAVCQRFVPSAATLRTVLSTTQQGPVLGPALYLLLLSPRNIAATAGITDPAVAAAMREVVAALDELAAQAQAKLPPGADPASTPVRLDPARASAALSAAESACSARSATPTTGR